MEAFSDPSPHHCSAPSKNQSPLNQFYDVTSALLTFWVRIRQGNHLVRFRETWFGIKSMIVSRRESVGRSFLMLLLPLHVATDHHDDTAWNCWGIVFGSTRTLKGCLSHAGSRTWFSENHWMQRKKKTAGGKRESLGKLLHQSADDVTTGCSVSHKWKFCPTNQWCAVFLFHCLVSAQLALNLNQVMTIANSKTRAEWFQASHAICLKWGLVSDWSGAADC